MTQSAQAIMMGRLSPSSRCARIDSATFMVELTPSELAWGACTFGFQLYQDQIHVVASYTHDDSVDRGHAVAKMRRTVRNLVDWFLLGQSLLTSASLSFGREQAIAKYEGDTPWVSHLDLAPEEGNVQTQPTTNDILEGGAILPFITRDPLLLYALQDYAAAAANPEFSLFLLYRALEWILWAYDKSDTGRNPSFAPAEKELSLPEGWLAQIGILAHNYVRHARKREPPDPTLVSAAQQRVKALILRHLRAAHGHPESTLQPLPEDRLTHWQHTPDTTRA